MDITSGSLAAARVCEVARGHSEAPSTTSATIAHAAGVRLRVQWVSRGPLQVMRDFVPARALVNDPSGPER